MNFSDRYRCFFVHIPKAAGTSIKTALDLPGRGHPPWVLLQRTYPRRWHEYHTFCVVRNPWDRFVSAYVYATLAESHWHGPDKGMHPDHAAVGKLSFAEFCHRIESRELTLQHESWLPQCFWIASPDSNALMVDQVLRYESLEEDFLGLCDRIGATDRELPRINVTERNPYRSYYDEHTRDLVAGLYRRDIELFGYSF